MGKECVICYSEFVGETQYFSCSHSNVCSMCVQKWTKSCPECRCDRNRRRPRYESPSYTYWNSIDDELRNEMCIQIKDTIESKYGILVENVQYGTLLTSTRFTTQNRYVFRFFVNKTTGENIHDHLRHIFETEFSVVCSHVNKTISVYY